MLPCLLFGAPKNAVFIKKTSQAAAPRQHGKPSPLDPDRRPREHRCHFRCFVRDDEAEPTFENVEADP